MKRYKLIRRIQAPGGLGGPYEFCVIERATPPNALIGVSIEEVPLDTPISDWAPVVEEEE